MLDRPILHLPEPLMQSYAWLADREDRVRLHTSRQHQEANDFIALYLIGLHLTCEAFRPGRSYPYEGRSTDPPGPQAHNLQQQLLGLAARTARPAFDLLLGGYYSEGMSLIRTMLESWGRAVYVRLQPCEFGRWYSPPDGTSEEYQARWGYGKPEPSFGSIIVNTIDQLGSSLDKMTCKEMVLRYRLMNPMVHPAGEAINQLRSAVDDKFLFGPDYIEDFCRLGFNHGLFVHRAVLREVRLLGDQSAEWDSLARNLDRLFEPLHQAIQAVLEQEEREIEEERKWRQYGPTFEEVKKARQTIAHWEANANAMRLPSGAITVRPTSGA